MQKCSFHLASNNNNKKLVTHKEALTLKTTDNFSDVQLLP